MHRSVEFRGRNATDLRAALFGELGSSEGIDTCELDGHRLLVSHRYRPHWATVTAICLTPLLGLGLLFLLVRRNAVGEIRVLDSPRGTTVTAVGILPADIEDRLFGGAPDPIPNDDTYERPVLAQRASHAADGPAPTGPGAKGHPDDRLDVTRVELDAGVEQSDATEHESRSFAAHRAGVLRASFVGPIPDVEIRLGDRVIVGRDPRPGDGSRQLVIDEAERTLSKSHAAIGFDEDGPYVEDLASTNGSLLQLNDQPPVKLVPGRRYRLAASSGRLQFGGVECVVVLELERSPGSTRPPDAERTVVRLSAPPLSSE